MDEEKKEFPIKKTLTKICMEFQGKLHSGKLKKLLDIRMRCGAEARAASEQEDAAKQSTKRDTSEIARIKKQCDNTLTLMYFLYQDVSTLHLGNFSGGVPMFWAHLKAHTHPSRTADFLHEPPQARLPAFGLGVLAPGAVNQTCEPDVPLEAWTPDWQTGDGTVGRAWRELCRLNRTRLCDLGESAIRVANEWQDHAGKVPIRG